VSRFGGGVAVAPRSNFAVRGGGGFYSRGGYAPRVYSGARYNGGYYGGGRYYGGARYYGGRYYAPVRFYRPYYAFRPRFGLGFGLFIGYPISYSYPYYYPDYYYPYSAPYAYAYPYPYASTYPAPTPSYPAPAQYDSAYPPQTQNSVGVQPGVSQADQQNAGGLSFEITPSDARVIVDGHELGAVGQFTPTSQPLGLPAGRHHVEIVANGYRSMSSDVDVLAGQVIPFQGVMER
jgi:hypothetical protein